MASAYSIVEADIVPKHMGKDDYDRLLAQPSSGGDDTDIDDVILEAEAEFTAHVRGLFTSAANLAMAKPLVVAVVVFLVHCRRTSNADYKVPESVTARYQAALKWADTKGAALFAAEGTVDPVGTGGVEYSAPTAEYTMAKLSKL